MTSKIDFLKIVSAHWKTLHHSASKNVSKSDIVLFYVAPAGIAAVLVWVLNRNLTTNAVNFLATIFSIFVGLLLNLLVIIIGQLPKKDEPKKGEPKESPSQATLTNYRDRLLEETFSNISYSILVSVILIVLLFLSRLTSGVLLQIASAISFAFVGNFLLTLLMILKRVDSILNREIPNHGQLR
ncbi:MAG TPA: hypothetical protein VHD61_11770 [Lacunisphaera sp.]|nr:hypothetical protein [Lacunisphaera sp.]